MGCFHGNNIGGAGGTNLLFFFLLLVMLFNQCGEMDC